MSNNASIKKTGIYYNIYLSQMYFIWIKIWLGLFQRYFQDCEDDDILLLTNFTLISEAKLLNIFTLSYDNEIAQITKQTKLIDTIAIRHDITLEPNTHQWGFKRIDFVFCSRIINNFIIRCGITSFDLISYSDDQRKNLDIQIIKFLKNSINSLSMSSRVLSTKNLIHCIYTKTTDKQIIET